MSADRISSIVAAGAIALAGCHGNSAPASARASSEGKYRATVADPLGFLPADSELVASFDVQRLRATKVWRSFEPVLRTKAGPVVGELQRTCGYDPMGTLQQIAIGLRGVGGSRQAGVVVLRGLDRARLMECIDQARTKVADKVVVDRGMVSIAVEPNAPPAVFTFVDPTTMVVMAGHGTSMASAVEVLERGVPLRRSQAFLALLRGVRMHDPLWFVVHGKALEIAPVSSLGLAPRALFGSVDLASGLAAAIHVRFDTSDEAGRLTQLADAQLGLVRGLFEQLEISAAEQEVLVRARMTPEQLDSVAELLQGD